MKLAISNIAWNEKDDETIYEKMQDLHFQFLEIAPTRWVVKNPYSANNIEEAKIIVQNIREKYGIKVCSMQSILYGVKERLFYSKQEREILQKKVKEAIYYANQIGCRHLVFGSPKNRIIKSKSQHIEGVAFFKELTQYAREQGVYLSIEANPTIYDTNYINTTEEALKLVQEVQDEYFGINYDLGTVIQNGETLDILKENMEKIHHIHISEPHLKSIQKRVIHRELSEILKKYCYKNVISIEMKKTENIQEIFNILAYISKIFS
ncbi:sugar phosphate isomerase/epimerase [Fusobacterium necrophorum]|uniref:sugar phosphate isomerase/epimerase family protein n=1 Tax=Fusobacterium necrophorum TaxID=859 RepID=UPI0008921F81|nr:TIM barrel protein [Fusobacterium necrophorum]AYZ73054.1 sugar phosphate isomerase/epimerase [Fusobacterium necrophorum]AZW08948.1 sugar phosphate isomerase/epimerase [Fusobacterium necrophorum subsp. necrophorum]SDB39969.1 Sugar phosphate isomerase/epimerase [Fusobacterium necrophorum]SQD09933.1 putative L-xylulose 5-phosphate 3-epimerase [Fusobacterium necrophorum subsp. necrophorum]